MLLQGLYLAMIVTIDERPEGGRGEVLSISVNGDVPFFRVSFSPILSGTVIDRGQFI